MNTIDWSKYLIEDTPLVEQEETAIQQSNQDGDQVIDWDQYLSKQDKWKLPESTRNPIRSAARFSETILGLPGDTVQFAKNLLEYLPKTPKILDREQNFIQKMGREVIESFPTSQELKEISSYLSNGFTDPQSAQEEFGDDIISLGTALLTGLKDPTKLKTLGKAYGLATAAKGGGKVAELYGAGEKGKSYTELGTLILSSLLTRRYADGFVKNKYQKARSLIPENTMQDTTSLLSDLNKAEIELSKGLPKTSSTKSKALSTLEEIKNKASGGAMPMEEIVDAYHDVNELRTSKKLFEDLNSTEKKLMKSRLDKVQEPIRKSIENYGKNNTEFYQEWEEANQAHSVLAKNRSAKDFIIKNMKTIPGHLLLSGAVKLFVGLPALGSLGAGFAAYQTGKIMTRIVTNPSLRKYYFEVINSASQENLPATIKSLSKLNKELEKEEGQEF